MTFCGASRNLLQHEGFERFKGVGAYVGHCDRGIRGTRSWEGDWVDWPAVYGRTEIPGRKPNLPGPEGFDHQGKRHGRLQNGSCLHGIIELDIALFSEDLIDAHAGASITIRVLQQDVGVRGIAVTAEDVEIIAQGINLSALHQRVFLVRIVAGFGGVILKIYRSLRLQTRQGPAAIVTGKDDLPRVRGVGGPHGRVLADHRWPVDTLCRRRG